MKAELDTLPAPETGEISEDTVSEANHRIANSLSLISSVVRLQAMAIGDKPEPMSRVEVRRLLREVSARIESVGLLHKLLTRQPKVSAVDIGDYLHEICAPLVESLSPVSPVDFVRSGSQLTMIGPEQAPLIALMVSELVMNAIKHAHPSGIRGKITVECNRGSDGAIAIRVADDGVGLPEGFDPRRDGDFGFRILRALAAQSHAELSFESTPLGLVARIRVPQPH